MNILRPPTILAGPGRRRGSAVVLVLAVLAVLFLLAVTMSYSSKTEVLAARNWANTVQARMAATTGVPLFASGSALNRPVQPRARLAAQDRLEALLGASPDGAAMLRPVSIRLTRSWANPAASPLEPAVDDGQRDDTGGMLAVRKDRKGQQIATNTLSGMEWETLAAAQVEDGSARLNINAIEPVREQSARSAAQMRNSADHPMTPAVMGEQILARLIAARFDVCGIQGINAQALAHFIALRRWGADGAPGTANVDDNENGLPEGPDKETRQARAILDESIAADGLDNDGDGQVDEADEGIDDPPECLADPRVSPNGDDRPYARLEEIMAIPGMTAEAFRAIEPCLTVFSVSFAAFELPDTLKESMEESLGFPQVDPNTAPAEEIYRCLRVRFPDAPRELLGQFTANMIDRRDADDIPCEIVLDGRTYWGAEITPYLNEVCPDPASLDEEGDDGQFIEIFNPYSRSFNLDGWKVSIVGGVSVPLRGSLPSQGYLVLTDDFDESNDPQPENTQGLGSFFDLFKVVPTGANRNLLEFPEMDLPNASGEVRLINPDGRVVDVFTYTDGQWTGAPYSFQRKDPRVRWAQKALATPLAPNRGVVGDDETARATLRILEQWQNLPFQSALDVMLVGSAFGGSDQTTSATAHFWAMPVLEAQDCGQMDVRLVDCFRVGARPKPERAQTSLAEATVASTFGAEAMTDARTASTIDLPTAPGCDRVFGMLNLNAAAPGVLEALPGMTGDVLGRIIAARQGDFPSRKDAGWWKPLAPTATPYWKNLSDFIRDEAVWEDRPLYDRLDAIYAFASLLTTHSAAVRVTSSSTATPESGGQAGGVRAERIMASDRGAVETVAFRFLPNSSGGTDELGDPDLRYASSESEANLVLDFSFLSVDYDSGERKASVVVPRRPLGKFATTGQNDGRTRPVTR